MPIYYAVIWLSVAVYSGNSFGHDFVVLPAAEYKDAVNQCTRKSPVVSGGWEIDTNSLKRIEEDIEKLNNILGGERQLSKELKQYVGVIVEGERYIYISGTRKRRMIFLLPRAAWTCDGGPEFWGALYDPQSREFSEFEFNDLF